MTMKSFRIENYDIVTGTRLESIPDLTGGMIHTWTTLICRGEGQTAFVYFLKDDSPAGQPKTELDKNRGSIILPYKAYDSVLALLDGPRQAYGVIRDNANWNVITTNPNA